MSIAVIQVPSIVLPQVAPLGTETELVADALEHTSLEFMVESLEEKTIHILATEAVIFGVPGPLNIWVELSPLPSDNNQLWPLPLPVSASYWAAIGGGGGPVPPATPLILIGTGVNLAQQTAIMPWTIHSSWARVVVQTPVPGAAAFWAVQIIVSGKST